MSLSKTVVAAHFAALVLIPLITPSVGLDRASAGSFNSLSGAWRGSGRLNLAGGKSERLSCRAYYNPKSGGSQLGMAVRCASPSYKFELRAQLSLSGNRVSGSWEERNFNVAGSASGTLRPGRMSLVATGSVQAGITVSYSGRSQSVSMRGNIGSFRGISLSFRK